MPNEYIPERDAMALLVEAHEEMAYREDRYRTLNCCEQSLYSNGWHHAGKCKNFVICF
jgi:hypothetical protein